MPTIQERFENVTKLNDELLDFLDKKGLLQEFYKKKLEVKGVDII